MICGASRRSLYNAGLSYRPRCRMPSRVVIRQQSPLRLAAGVLAAVVALGASTYGGYRIGLFAATRPALDAAIADESPSEERRRLLRQLRRTQDELASIQNRDTFDARNAEIDSLTCGHLQDAVSKCESGAASLREELAFYRNIVTPEKGQGGLRVQEAVIEPGATPQDWHYELLLVRAVRNQSHANGELELRLEGQAGGERRVLEWADLTPAGTSRPVFSVRYFQEITGDLRVPADFRPLRLSVTLVVKGDRQQKEPIAETFDWSRIVRDIARSES